MEMFCFVFCFFLYSRWFWWQWIYFLPFQVVERLLSIPAKYWGQFAFADSTGMNNAHGTDTPDSKGKLMAGDNKNSSKMSMRIRRYTLFFLYFVKSNLIAHVKKIKTIFFFFFWSVVSILGPVTTPEHQTMVKTPSSSSLSQRVMHTLSSTTMWAYSYWHTPSQSVNKKRDKA